MYLPKKLEKGIVMKKGQYGDYIAYPENILEAN